MDGRTVWPSSKNENNILLQEGIPVDLSAIIRLCGKRDLLLAFSTSAAGRTAL